jgi:glycosyltransferase involved in cell wall biosynthesis
MENNKIFFSIIVPTYNRADIILETIESLLRQNYPHFELLVIDDGSKDNTRSVINTVNDPRVKYYWKENAERGAARNYGLSLAKGDYVNFFDSDDIAYPNHLETAQNIIKNHNYEVFHTGFEFNIDGKVAKRTNNEGILNLTLLQSNILSCNNVFIIKNVFDSLKFSENRGLSGTEDWVLWLQLAARYDIVGFKDVTSVIIEHSSRSMVTATGESTLQRANILHEILQSDAIFMEKYGDKESFIYADMLALSSLFFAIRKNRYLSIKYLFKSIKMNKFIVLNKRFLAIIKHLVLPI